MCEWKGPKGDSQSSVIRKANARIEDFIKRFSFRQLFFFWANIPTTF